MIFNTQEAIILSTQRQIVRFADAGGERASNSPRTSAMRRNDAGQNSIRYARKDGQASNGEGTARVKTGLREVRDQESFAPDPLLQVLFTLPCGAPQRPSRKIIVMHDTPWRCMLAPSHGATMTLMVCLLIRKKQNSLTCVRSSCLRRISAPLTRYIR